MEDADLDKAADLAVAGATKNSGQRCTAVKRILVRKGRRRLRRARAGEGEEAQVRRSDGSRRPMSAPSIHERAAQLFEDRVNDALAKPAPSCFTATTGKGALYPPTVVDRVTPDMELVREETFGPVSRSSASRTSTMRSGSRTPPPMACLRASAPIGSTASPGSSPSSRSARSISGKCRAIASRSRPSAASRIPALASRKACIEAMKSFTNVKTCSLPWPG